jgi:hypothetical protein
MLSLGNSFDEDEQFGLQFTGDIADLLVCCLIDTSSLFLSMIACTFCSMSTLLKDSITLSHLFTRSSRAKSTLLIWLKQRMLMTSSLN